MFKIVKLKKLKKREKVGLTERDVTLGKITNWEEYKAFVREEHSDLVKEIDEAEALSAIIGAMIEQRHCKNLSQRELAALCGLPHSSVARIESGVSTPNLSTLLNIFSHLGLRLVVQNENV